jgi:acetylglutamate kinase
MKEIIAKAEVLIDALPYIQNFRGEIVVVKIGGSAMEDESNVTSVLTDVAFMECVGMLPVVIHGGDKAISRGMQNQGIEPNFVQGLRVTCEETIKVVEKVIKAEVSPKIVQALKDAGATVEGIHGEDVFHVHRKTGVDTETGQPIDWGFVGEPKEVDTAAVLTMLNNRTIPVLTPLGMGTDGKIHNVNADIAAAALAKALKARKLAFLSDVPGLLSDAENPDSLISTVEVGGVEQLIDNGTISGGMLPKIQSGVDALHAGVRKVHLIDGRMPHSLLLELFTDEGVGTQIIQNL